MLRLRDFRLLMLTRIFNSLAWQSQAVIVGWQVYSITHNAFMLGLFKQGAFAGNTPSEAFKVQCDSQTTTQTDVDMGIVNIVVSFAPLKPAEFVVITIAQLAGQAQTG